MGASTCRTGELLFTFDAQSLARHPLPEATLEPNAVDSAPILDLDKQAG